MALPPGSAPSWRFFLEEGGEGFLEEHEEQGQAEHHRQHGGCRAGDMAGHEQDDGQNQAAVEDEAGGAVGVKPELLRVLLPAGC